MKNRWDLKRNRKRNINTNRITLSNLDIDKCNHSNDEYNEDIIDKIL